MQDFRGALQGGLRRRRIAAEEEQIDTGMGLDRVAFLLQGKNNMSIDVMFREKAEQLTGRRYGAEPEDDVRFVVADHVRLSDAHR